MSKFIYRLVKGDKQYPLTELWIDGVQEWEYEDDNGERQRVEHPCFMVAEMRDEDEPRTEPIL